MHPSEPAEFVYNSVSSYYDLEEHNGELYMQIGLGELLGLSSALGIKVQVISFDNGKSDGSVITPDQEH